MPRVSGTEYRMLAGGVPTRERLPRERLPPTWGVVRAWVAELVLCGCVLVAFSLLLQWDTAELATANRPLTLGIDEGAARDVLHFAWAVYCPRPALRDWTCQWCDRIKDVELIKVASNATVGTRAYVAHDKANNRLVVAIRGTTNNLNVVEDAKPWLERFPPGPPAVLVHHGFLNSYRSVKDDIETGLRQGLDACESCSVLFTGHSMGAAVATLAATDLAGSPARPASGVTLFNFGSPRVGNPAFAEWASNVLGKNTTRMVREGDIVPSLASEYFGYKHVLGEVWNRHYNGTEWYVKCATPSGENDRCHNSEWHLSASEHLMYMGEAGGYCNGWNKTEDESWEQMALDWLEHLQSSARHHQPRLRGL